ncbi:MAG TPA: hypothetical protein VNY30_17015 [Bryobacteraceae bacterium]|jgi:hypothetical protein|nr:hypothetical protein [Bryobacteraceae bacterium]
MPEPPDLFEPRMPKVDQPRDIHRVFDQARKSAAGEHVSGKDHSRQVVLVTPGRTLMLQPCPAPGSMPPNVVSQIESLISPKVKRKIAVIAYTELPAVTKGLSQAIPFFGMLVGIAYIGHSVWIFEGHSTALAAGSKEADLLIVDSGMVPHLPPDWQTLASSEAPALEIYVHDRTNHSLRKVN